MKGLPESRAMDQMSWAPPKTTLQSLGFQEAFRQPAWNKTENFLLVSTTNQWNCRNSVDNHGANSYFQQEGVANLPLLFAFSSLFWPTLMRLWRLHQIYWPLKDDFRQISSRNAHLVQALITHSHNKNLQHLNDILQMTPADFDTEAIYLTFSTFINP